MKKRTMLGIQRAGSKVLPFLAELKEGSQEMEPIRVVVGLRQYTLCRKREVSCLPADVGVQEIGAAAWHVGQSPAASVERR